MSLVVTLFNFRCHQEKVFRFSSGLNLIDGTSGKGKTTILEAIHFCLIGKHRNVVSRGEKKCSVTLSIEPADGGKALVIQRTKMPSRLTIQPLGLEDDVAQEYIHQLIGGEDFELTSYMLQKGTSQFFTLSSTEKRKFVEALSKRNTQTVDKMKDRVVLDLKSKKHKLVQLETTLSMLSQSVTTVPELLVDLKLDRLEDIKCVEQMSSVVHSRLYSSEQVLSKQLSDYSQKIQQQAKQKEQQAKLATQLSLLQQQYSTISDELLLTDFSPVALDEVNQKIDMAECYTLYQKKKEELQERKKTYEQLVQQEDTEHKKQLAQLESKLTEVPTDELALLKKEVEQLEHVRQQAKRRSDLLLKQKKLEEKKISTLAEKKRRLEELKTFVQEMDGRKTFQKCPHCSGSLTLSLQIIQKASQSPLTEEEQSRIKQYKKDIPLLQAEVDELYKWSVMAEQVDSELKNIPLIPEDTEKDYIEKKKQIETIQGLIQQNNLLQTQLAEKKAYVPKDKYSTLRKQFEQGVEQLKSMKKGDQLSDEEVELLKKKKQVMLEAKVKKEQLEKSSTELKKKMGLVESETEKIPVVDETNYSLLLEQVSEKREKVQSELSKMKDINRAVELYKAYATEKIAVRKRETKKEQTQKAIQYVQKEILELETFQRKITEAENKCVEDTIDLINQKVKIYLDRFFQTDPMTMCLMTEKEVASKKSVKSELNIQITYKDAACDLTSLSGGEYDRCALAFMLAINELSSSPFLIMDESISSLDLGNAENVLEVLKDVHPNKFVLLVSHQANTGMFDHVVGV